jgi:hypothetical protein
MSNYEKRKAKRAEDNGCMSHPPVAPSESDPEPQAPAEPDFDACCGNGCEPCIYDLYDLEMDRYRNALRAWKERQAARKAATE